MADEEKLGQELLLENKILKQQIHDMAQLIVKSGVEFPQILTQDDINEQTRLELPASDRKYLSPNL